MSLPKHEITPIIASDLLTLANFIFLSNFAQATNRFLFLDWPNEAAQTALFLSGLEKSSQDSDQQMWKVVDEESGAMIASLILTRKRPIDNSSERGKQKPAVPEGVNGEFLAVMRQALEVVQKDMEGIDYLVLSSIFVDLTFRERGLGSKLVNLSLQKAAEGSLSLFLSSVPSATGFYRKLGFANTVHTDVDLGTWGPEFGGCGVYRLQGMIAKP
ncbi:hypothetical protein G7Y89_g5744 [Cudoniella acicularis]|uniref:N-acetyltransferase domain-containing protein n=1 Tax=Cudoniella acicularis TaxID=354080 RepID=A0A8H4RP46_9HELO|nr:hypothetical protein G7Y89_g5744 [Cudoniella acicularis]